MTELTDKSTGLTHVDNKRYSVYTQISDYIHDSDNTNYIGIEQSLCFACVSVVSESLIHIWHSL